MKLSVVCPVFNEEKYIGKCIDSLLNQIFPQSELEILIVDGMSTDRTRSVIKGFADNCKCVKLLDNPNRTVPYAMNIGIREAVGDLIMRVDAHTTYPDTYFSDIVAWHEKLGDAAWNVGGVCVTKVLNSTKTSEAIARVMCDKFGVGASKFRTTVEGECMETITVPFGCYKRFVFEKIGLFNDKLTRVQDMEFNRRVRDAGGKIYLIPSIKCTYIPRETFKAIANNRFMTGYWCIKTCFLTKTLRSLRLRHFIPFLFVLSLILTLLFSCVWSHFLFVFVVLVLLYLACVLFRSVAICDGKTDVFHLVIAFASVHFSYGLGSFKCFIDLLLDKIKSFSID